MFSVEQKRSIAEKVQQILRETGHPELPKGEIKFFLHVDGAEAWSWADIRNNGDVPTPGVNPHNEKQAAVVVDDIGKPVVADAVKAETERCALAAWEATKEQRDRAVKFCVNTGFSDSGAIIDKLAAEFAAVAKAAREEALEQIRQLPRYGPEYEYDSGLQMVQYANNAGKCIYLEDVERALRGGN